MLDYSKSFIEMQFPISKLSKESYKERKSVQSQTLTGLGKWWGRKPLILVRATILGLLMPVSENPKRDKEIYLKILLMDNDGLKTRKSKKLSTRDIYELLTTSERYIYFEENSTREQPIYKGDTTKEDKDYLQLLAFERLTYDEKLNYCDRPEHIPNLSEKVWEEVNRHLETSSFSFAELIHELGIKRFGHVPRVGDCFSGGGSIPFEASRLGCNVYASDLNPVASLLTWSSLKIAGASDDDIIKLKEFQKAVYNAVDKQITEWKIEHNNDGHRANAFLYCCESICPECGYKVPLSTSWIIGKGSNTVATLVDNGVDGFNIEIKLNASKEDWKKAEKQITIKDGSIYCPHCKHETSIASLRKDKKGEDGETIYGLRRWERNEYLPRPEDVFQERLFCIRYEREYIDSNGNIKTERYYQAPDKFDLAREQKVIDILSGTFTKWQENGYIPSSLIENGDKTDEPIRTRGWQYWHQLFNPRQLLMHGLFAEKIVLLSKTANEKAIGLLGLNRICDWNSKLCRWGVGEARESMAQTFYNQAFNTMYQYGTRGLTLLNGSWFTDTENFSLDTNDARIHTIDARNIEYISDLWITDPPYADAVNYHELTEFFLAWDKKILEDTFPNWYSDSKRVLAVKGTGKPFNDSMIEIYKNLAEHMPDNGMQVVMFTHQDVKVWAELAMILWSSGLSVVSAWNIATETESAGIKQGNYVKGTVLLVLKKQTSDNIVFQDELYEEIKHEVKFQIDSMRDLDDKEDPNFTDADYLLASYASSLKVLTSYKNIEGINVEYELSRIRGSDEISPIEEIIHKAVKIAYDYLIPEDIDKLVWRDLSPEERFFIRGLELESNNIYQISAYQELARGFGVTEYKDMFENFKANSVRFKTASEYKSKSLNDEEFGKSLVRNLLVAIHLSVQADTTVEGRNYLKSTYDRNNEYWAKRASMIELLEFISRFEKIRNMQHWHRDSYFAKLLKEAIRNDGV